MNSLTFTALSTLFLLAACGSAGGADRQSLPAGTWGGDHVNLTVTEESVTIEFDCAHGTLKGPIQPDAEGRFETAGTYVQEHAGPLREEDEAAAGNPARYTGQVEKGKMTLTIAFPEGRGPLGPFELTHGKAARLTKCM